VKFKGNTYRTIVSLLFLAAFVNALAKNIVCDWEHLPIFTVETEGHTHDHGDHHHHEHGATVPPHNHDDHSHNSEKKKDGCCEKLATSLYSSLVKPVQVKFDFTKSFDLATLQLSDLTTTSVVCYKAADYFSWKAPPPKIPDIRVFIHSFII
jgi:hypothetical protein